MANENTIEGSVPKIETTTPPEDHGVSSWTTMVPKETAEANAELLSQYDTFDNFVNSSVKAIGEAEKYKDYEGKTFVPQEDANEDIWNDFWGKMGKPADKKDYGIEEEALASMFYSANLTKSQADALSKGLVDYSEESQKEFKEQQSKLYQESITALKEKYGTDIDMKLASANTAMNNLGGEGLVKTLQEKGLDNDPSMIEFFVNVGSLMQEGNIPIGHALNPSASGLEGTYDSMKGIE